MDEITIQGGPPAPAPAAAPPPQGPAVISPEAGKVAIRDPDGTVSLVPSDRLQAVIAEGARPATPLEYFGAKTGVAGQAASFALGAGRGASFGLSDPALIEGSRLIGGDAEAEDTRWRLNLAKDINPNASFGGEVAGAIVPTLFGAPPAAAADEITGSLLSRAGQRALSAAPRAIAEGAGIGAGQQISEDALGNHETTAQKLVASAAQGAVFGLLLGVGTHVGVGRVADAFTRAAPEAESALARGFSTYGAKDVDALAERQFGATERGVGKGVVEDLRQAYAKGAAGVSGKDAATIEELTRFTPEGREARRIGVFDAEKELETAQRELRTSGDALVRESPELMSEFRGEMKGDKIAAHVAPDKEVRHVPFIDADAGIGEAPNAIRPLRIGPKGEDVVNFNGSVRTPPRSVGLADTIEAKNAPRGGSPIGIDRVVEVPEGAAYAKKEIARIAKSLESELAHPDGTAKNFVSTIRDLLKSAAQSDGEIVAAVEGGEKINATSFMALDRLKRDVQGFTDGGYRRVAQMTNPYEARLARRTVDKLNGLQNDLRHGLEDTQRWGKAGEIQAKINADWTKQIDASKRFHRALTTEVGRDPTNPFLKLRGIDPSRLDTYSRNLLNPHADLTHQAVKDYVASTESLARTVRENLALPPEQMARVARIEAAAQKFRGTVEKTEKTLTTVNQVRALTEKTTDSAAALAGSLGFAAGGPIGGLIGSAVGALSSPGRVVAQLAAIERMGAKVDAKFGAAARSFFSGGAPKALPVAATSAETKVTNETIRSIRDIVSNPSALQAKISAAIAPFLDVAPKVAQAMATTMTRAAMHLARVLPHEPEPMGLSFVPRPPRPMSDVKLAKAAKSIEGVNDIDSVSRDLAQGRLSREHIDALRDVYPDLFESLKNEVRQEAIRLAPKTSIQQEVALSVLFGEPLNAMMQPKNVRAFQSTFAQGADPSKPTAQAGGPQPNAPKRPLTKAGGTLAAAFDRFEAPDVPG